MIVITADVGGTKTTAAITNDGVRIAERHGPGSAVRPGRALVTATAVADLMRSTLAQAKLLRADVIVVGAAGAGRPADAEEIRSALARERIADRVIVVSDVDLAFEALGIPVGAVLVAGTGSIAIGRTPDGRSVRQGGYGWQMGDEGGGYWIGRAALVAAGLARDGRGPSTGLTTALLAAAGTADFRDLVGWASVAGPREIAHLSGVVAMTARNGDAVAKGILDRAAAELARMVNQLAPEFAPLDVVPLGFAGGLLRTEGSLGPAVVARIGKPFVPIAEPIDPLVGGPRLAAVR